MYSTILRIERTVSESENVIEGFFRRRVRTLRCPVNGTDEHYQYIRVVESKLRFVE